MSAPTLEVGNTSATTSRGTTKSTWTCNDTGKKKTNLNAERISGDLFEDKEISDLSEYEECQYLTFLGDHDSFSESSERD
jgi:hypothetical protein